MVWLKLGFQNQGVAVFPGGKGREDGVVEGEIGWCDKFISLNCIDDSLQNYEYAVVKEGASLD